MESAGIRGTKEKAAGENRPCQVKRAGKGQSEGQEPKMEIYCDLEKEWQVMHEVKDVKEIKITYEDGSEKIVTRGVCFSVYEKDGLVYVSCDGLAGSENDEIAVLAIVSRLAREMGIDETLCDKAEVVEGGVQE